MRNSSAAARWGVAAGIVTAGVCAVFAWLGVVNGDEGWYALTARLVAGGQLPYRDFAFTQGPVYLFVLAPFMRIAPGLHAARAVSVMCAGAAVGLLIATAYRVGGRWAAGVSGVALLATIPSLPYWLSVTKTYSVSCLLIAAILFTLTSSVRPSVRYPIAAVLAVILTGTRTSAGALALLLILAILVVSPDSRTRRYVIGAALLASLPFLGLILLSPTRAQWGLVGYHQLGARHDADVGQFISRTGAAIEAWPGPFVLGAAAVIVVLVDAESRAHLRRRLDLTAVAVGILLFVVVHESGAFFFSEEYLAPLIAPIVVMSVIVLVRVALRRDEGARSRGSLLVTGLLVAGVVTTVVTGGHSYYLGRPGWGGRPGAVGRLVSCVRSHSGPGDTVFALSLEEVVVEARRPPVPGVSLGVFSYQNVSTRRAHELKILNSRRVLSTFRNTPPKVLVMTAGDFLELQRRGWFSHRKINPRPLNATYSAYTPVCNATIIRKDFVNHRIHYTVYARP